MALINEVYDYIVNKYKTNEPIFLAELDIPDMKPVSIRQQIKKLTEDGRLKRLTQEYITFPKKQYFVRVPHCRSTRLSEKNIYKMVLIAVVMLEALSLQTNLV